MRRMRAEYEKSSCIFVIITKLYNSEVWIMSSFIYTPDAAMLSVIRSFTCLKFLDLVKSNVSGLI
jgi:hypothetical protein